MQRPIPTENVDGGGCADWPACENVLRALSEDVRPAWAVAAARDDERVAADVRSCLAERVAPHGPPGPHGPPPPAGHLAAGPADESPRSRPRWRPYARPGDATAAAAGRAQTRLMAVLSAYADGKYYASDAPYASRTVEELSLWRRWPAAAAADQDQDQDRDRDQDRDFNVNTYTAGTVTYDRDTGACHLRGLWDPRRRVAVDCGRLTNRLPGHGSAVKMFSELRAAPRDDDHDGGGGGGGGGAPVLVPHHFQVFRPPRRFHED